MGFLLKNCHKSCVIKKHIIPAIVVHKLSRMSAQIIMDILGLYSESSPRADSTRKSTGSSNATAVQTAESSPHMPLNKFKLGVQLYKFFSHTFEGMGSELNPEFVMLSMYYFQKYNMHAFARKATRKTLQQAQSCIEDDRLGKPLDGYSDESMLDMHVPQTHVLVICMLLADVFINDSTFSLESWSILSSLPIAQLFIAKQHVLELMQFELHVSLEELDAWMDLVRDSRNGKKRRLSLTTLVDKPHSTYSAASSSCATAVTSTPIIPMHTIIANTNEETIEGAFSDATTSSPSSTSADTKVSQSSSPPTLTSSRETPESSLPTIEDTPRTKSKRHSRIASFLVKVFRSTHTIRSATNSIGSDPIEQFPSTMSAPFTTESISVPANPDMALDTSHALHGQSVAINSIHTAHLTPMAISPTCGSQFCQSMRNHLFCINRNEDIHAIQTV